MTATVVITGSNGGIGTALCQVFHVAGYHVVGLDLQEQTHHAYADDFISIDLYRLVNEADYAASAKLKLNQIKADVLVNNAAVQLLGDFDTYALEDWRATYSVNVDAAFVLSQVFYPSLKERKGQIINIASIHHKLSKAAFFAYASSKAALVGLTKAMAMAIGKEVRVNAISPAAIQTKMLEEGLGFDQSKLDALNKLHPTGQIASPNDLAEFVLTIAKADSGFLNGANIPFDGGIGNALLDIDAWE